MKMLMKIVLIAVLQFVLLSLSSCTIDAKYSVSGSAGSASVVYAKADGEIVELRNVSLPWEKSVSGSAGDMLYLSAMIGSDGGKVYTKIYKEGSEYKESHSEGAFSLSECYGEY